MTTRRLPRGAAATAVGAGVGPGERDDAGAAARGAGPGAAARAGAAVLAGLGAVQRLNWRPLLFAAAPLGYLVVSGAGLNPFVCMAGIGGIIMVLLDPVDGERPRWSRTLSALSIVAILVAGLTKLLATDHLFGP